MKKKHTVEGFGWILFVAARSFSKKRGKSNTSSLLSIFEIGAGVLALTVIIAVMNGFQLGFIENILEVSSYYIRVNNVPQELLSKSSMFAAANGVTAMVPFLETQGIISGSVDGGQCAALFRGVPAYAFKDDEGLSNHLELISGRLELNTQNEVLIGVELAARLNARAGNSIEFLSIANLFSSEDNDAARHFVIAGIFRTGYYEYDSSWGFINLSEASAIEGGKETCTLGIKLKNRFADAPALAQIEAMLPAAFGSNIITQNNITVTSWRDYNKSFFNALRTEKLLMFILVGLIFVVVALNIYQSQRRTVLERSEEIGLLRAIGAHDFSVRWTFALKGLIIGLSGATGGMILALLIASHIQEFFALIEAIITGVLHIVYSISSGIFFGGVDFSVFSKNIFYIQEYTARLIPHEVLLIYCFAVLSAFLAAWFASARISKIKPSEVLRCE